MIFLVRVCFLSGIFKHAIRRSKITWLYQLQTIRGEKCILGCTLNPIAKWLYLIMQFAFRYLMVLLMGCMLFLLHSCKKDVPNCEVNCYGTNFSGIVFDQSNNQPLANQMVSFSLQKKQYCFGCTSYDLGSTISDADGRFSFKKLVDSDYFTDYNFLVTLTLSSKYLLFPAPVEAGPPAIQTASIRFAYNDTSMFNNLRFGLFPKTLLTVNLHRINPIAPQYPFSAFTIAFGNAGSGSTFVQSPANADTTFTYNTSAGLFTTITVATRTPLDSAVMKSDSIMCLPNTANSITISY